jgi:RHS repeat-associated protein
VNGTPVAHFLWDQGHLLAELDGTDTLRVAEYAYYPGVDQPLAIITGATAVAKTSYLQQDPLGSVIGAVTSGAVVDGARFGYDPWGFYDGVSVVGVATTDTNRLRFQGLVYEGDSTQLYYVRNRWYDPRTHRFSTQDPIGLGGGMNPYAFAANDPVNRKDPDGLTDCITVELPPVEVCSGSSCQQTPLEWRTVCFGGPGGGLGLGPVNLRGAPGGGPRIGPANSAPARPQARIRFTPGFSCYQSTAYFGANFLADWIGAREVYGGAKLIGKGMWSVAKGWWGPSVLREYGRTFAPAVRRGLVTAGSGMIISGAPEVTGHAGHIMTEANEAVYEGMSGWSDALEMLVPGLGSWNSLRDAGAACTEMR